MSVCAVTWCVAEAESGRDVCAVHRINRALQPDELDAKFETCDACKGSGMCATCQGEKYHECECHCGDRHDADCDECDHTGTCQECSGSGKVSA